MKWLLVLLALAAGVWLWRSGREDRGGRANRHGAATPKPTAPMVPCRHCGVHIPREEALPGASGLYCSAAHRQLAER